MPLAVAQGIAGRPAVAGPDPERAVRAGDDPAAVVVRERLVDPEKHPLGGRVRGVRGGIPRPELRHERVPVRVGGVDVEASVTGERRRERKPQQAALAARRDLVADIEVGQAQQPPSADHPDGARLLDDEDAPAAIARATHPQRTVEPRDSPGERERWRIPRGGRRRRRGRRRRPARRGARLRGRRSLDGRRGRCMRGGRHRRDRRSRPAACSEQRRGGDQRAGDPRCGDPRCGDPRCGDPRCGRHGRTRAPAMALAWTASVNAM